MLSEEPDNEISSYVERMRVLGHLRLLILKCINAINPKLPGYFNPSQEADLFQECRCHFERLYEQEAATANQSGANLGVAIFAAGLLTYGCLEMAEVILENIQSKYETDHGCGYCNLAPMLIFCIVLPLPREIGYCTFTLCQIDLEAAKKWLHENRTSFKWNDETERFVIC